jgi:hypothetical protein
MGENTRWHIIKWFIRIYLAGIVVMFFIANSWIFTNVDNLRSEMVEDILSGNPTKMFGALVIFVFYGIFPALFWPFFVPGLLGYLYHILV